MVCKAILHNMQRAEMGERGKGKSKRSTKGPGLEICYIKGDIYEGYTSLDLRGSFK